MPILLPILSLALAQAPTYNSEADFSFVGWRSQGRYVVYENSNGGPGVEMRTRSVMDAVTGRTIKRWSFESDSDHATADSQYAAWLKAHSPTRGSKTLFIGKGSRFTPDKKIGVVIKSGSFSGYTVKLDENLGEIKTTPEGDVKYRLAKLTVSVRKGNGVWKILQKDRDFWRDSISNGIDRVVLSPNGKTIAVVITEYHGTWFEGWNLAAVRTVVTGSLP